MTPPMGGQVAPGFEAVGDAFADLLSQGTESGAGLAIARDGHLVVDVYGGWRDAEQQRPWTSTTLVNTYSVSKPFAAMCLMLLVERELAQLDDPVAAHWPEFQAADVTLRHVLAHTSGLAVFPVPRPAAAIADWDLLVGDLAGATPTWTPGTVAAEHALTYGHLVGELVRRLSGRTIGEFLAEEIARPWGLDLGVGLSATDMARCAELVYGDPDWPVTILGDAGSLRARALGNPSGCLDLAVLNSGLWRGSQVPAVNMHATAAAVARFYAGLLDGGVLGGVRLWSAETVAEATRVQYDGPDLLLERDVRWSLGMQVDDDTSWGMGGIGGNLGYADPVRGYALGYVTRHLAGFERVDTLIEALHSCL